jgi:MFS family permease
LPPAPDLPRPPGRWWVGTFRALRHRNYRLYFFGQLISVVGTWMQTTALMQLAYNLTGQSSWPSGIIAASILPTLFLGAWGGALADRLPRRGLIFVCQALFLGQAALLAVVAAGLFGPPSPWALLVLAGVGGLIVALDVPARMAFVIDLVGRDDLVNAVALNSLLFNVARALGPAIAGLLMVHLSAASCFLLNALSYVAVLIALAAMDPIPTRHTPRPRDGRPLWDGLRYLMERPGLVLLLALAGAMHLFSWPMQSLLPALSARKLGGGEAGAGWLLSALGVGALLGALLVASFGSRVRRGLLLGVGVGLSAAGLGGLAAAPTLPLALPCSIVLGCGLILFFATGQAVIQLGARDHNRGLLLGIWTMTWSATVPLGNLLAGQAADRWGEPLVLGVQALGILIAGAAVGLAVLARARAAAPTVEAETTAQETV